jgi:hypothetical protein
LGIIDVDLDATGHLLIIHSAFAKYLRKNGNATKQRISSLKNSRKLYDSVRKEVLCNILIEFGTPMKLVKANKNITELNV